MSNSLQLLTTIVQENLYQKLILQLEKDFLLCNESFTINQNTKPQELINSLQTKIYDLISFRFNKYLNLLYIIDVSEEQVKSINSFDLLFLSQEISFLILKREWQKVYYKNKYST